MRQADEVREHVNRVYIEPARRLGRREIVIRASNVHDEMKLENRYPAVCGALDAHKFQEICCVRRIGRDGPAQSSSVMWRFEILS